MRILIDADACPVTRTAERVANAPLLTYLLINTDTNIICILPSASQDASCYDGCHRLRMTPPCRWERADGHYAIMGVNPFADRLYRHMGWDRALSFIIPAIPVPGDCVIPDLDARCDNRASGNPEPLFFDLNAAISPDTSLSASTTPCQGTMLLEV